MSENRTDYDLLKSNLMLSNCLFGSNPEICSHNFYIKQRSRRFSRLGSCSRIRNMFGIFLNYPETPFFFFFL